MGVVQARGALEMPLRENKCRPLADAFGQHVGLPMQQVCTGTASPACCALSCAQTMVVDLLQVKTAMHFAIE